MMPPKINLILECLGYKRQAVHNLTGPSGDLHSPFRTGFEGAIEITEHFAARRCGLLPRRPVVRKFDAISRQPGCSYAMGYSKKIEWHSSWPLQMGPIPSAPVVMPAKAGLVAPELADS
jgi:hypothetical protein